MQYELLYIVSGQITDDEADQVKDKVSKIIEKTGVKITRNENLGKLKLAYPIKHVRHGFYILVEFGGEAGAIRQIERELRLIPEVLRQQAIKLSVKSPAQEGEAKKEIKMISYEAPEREGDKPKVKREKPKPAPTKKVNLDELDKKLDEILESDVKV